MLVRFPIGSNLDADTSLFADSRALSMIGLAPTFPGVAQQAFSKKIVVPEDFSHTVSGCIQYTGTSASTDRQVICYDGVLYTAPASVNVPTSTPDALNPTIGSFTVIPDHSGVTLANTGNVTDRIRAVQFRNEMIIVQAAGSIPIRYNGSALYRLGIVAPVIPTDGGQSSAGGLLIPGGIYSYAYTYADELDRESSPSPYLTVTMGANGGRLIGVTASSDAQVQKIYVYRTTANNTLLYRIKETGYTNSTATITDKPTATSDQNTDTNIVFNTSAPLPGQNDPPLAATLVSLYKFRLALNGASDHRLLQISNLSTPSQFSQLGAVFNSSGQLTNAADGITFDVLNEWGDEITSLGHLGSVLGVWNRRTVGIFEGDNPAQYQFRIIHRTGSIAPDAVTECGNTTMFMAEDGLYGLSFENGYLIRKMSTDMDSLFRSVSVQYDPPGDFPPTTWFDRDTRAQDAIGIFLQDRYILATPPYAVIWDFNHSGMYLDYLTTSRSTLGDGYLPGGYLCLSRAFVDRQFQVAFYSPGIGSGQNSGAIYCLSYYGLTQNHPNVPNPFQFIYQTRDIDGSGVHRSRLKKFKKVSLFGSITGTFQSNGTTVTSRPLFSGTISLITDNGFMESHPFQMSQGVGAALTVTYLLGIAQSAVVSTPGFGYSVGDILIPDGGTPTGNDPDLTALFTVATVNSTGGVATVTVTNPGLYTLLPTNPVSTNTYGSGTWFNQIQVQGRLIMQEFSPSCRGRAVQVLVQGLANGRLSMNDILVEYMSLEGANPRG